VGTAPPPRLPLRGGTRCPGSGDFHPKLSVHPLEPAVVRSDAAPFVTLRLRFLACAHMRFKCCVSRICGRCPARLAPCGGAQSRYSEMDSDLQISAKHARVFVYGVECAGITAELCPQHRGAANFAKIAQIVCQLKRTEPTPPTARTKLRSVDTFFNSKAVTYRPRSRNEPPRARIATIPSA